MEPKITVLGAVTIEPGETVSFSFPPNADPDAIKAAIEKANAERAEKLRAELAELRRLFIEDDKR